MGQSTFSKETSKKKRDGNLSRDRSIIRDRSPRLIYIRTPPKIVFKEHPKSFHPLIQFRPRLYYTHDNGGRPFRVYIDEEKKIAMISLNEDEIQSSYPFIMNKLFKFDDVFIGKDTDDIYKEKKSADKNDGNSILFLMKRDEHDHNNDEDHEEKHHELYEYMFVGSEIIIFTTDSPIIRFESPIGNSDVPYPFAVNTNDTYFLLNHYYIFFHSKDFIGETPYDPYEYYEKYERRRPREFKSLDRQVVVRQNYWDYSQEN